MYSHVVTLIAFQPYTAYSHVDSKISSITMVAICIILALVMQGPAAKEVAKKRLTNMLCWYE